MGLDYLSIYACKTWMIFIMAWFQKGSNLLVNLAIDRGEIEDSSHEILRGKKLFSLNKMGENNHITSGISGIYI